MGVRLASFVVWFAVAASLLFWGLRLMSRPMAAPAHTSAVQPAPAAAGADLSRLLGAAAPVAAPTPGPAAAVVPTDSRFKLLGVVAPRGEGGTAGLALISIDGKPPRAFGLGATVETPLVVLSVQHRGVQLGPRGGPAQVRLGLPALPAAARGSPGPVAAAPLSPGFAPQGAPVPPPQQALVPVPPPPTAVLPQPVSTMR